ncbi:Imm26 family immunity protein [Flavobacterium humi]|uniref:Uncharacterized protein n=1 Tax=Flavobacterium humi TaxID=2562683 RepID=A0A4Z0L6D3_9FLAO|nr:Imm26 family immunity protein [Flavobacterium humi]TGD56531.1 hypothetical protein E4635_15615 [Flavobacterium humi]
MTRTIKKGDIFSVQISENTKRYFQYIENDLTQLNSDVVRIFKKVYSISDKSELSEIVNDEVDFYAHCVIKFGIKMKLWEKVGNVTFNEKVDVIFRGTNDYGTKVGEEPIKISNNWYVWRTNDADFTKVGKLSDENKKSYIGLVFNPAGLVELIKGNRYPINYPDFE